MKKLALRTVGTCYVLACGLLAVPNVSTAQKLGAPPAAIETPYQTEQAWVLREVVGDINEIARYRTKQPAAAVFTENITPWHPELLAGYAATQLALAPGGKPNEQDPPDQFPQLLDLSADAIVRANATVSAALKRDIRNPRAHEAAALVLAAFGLRESADALSDSRWVLNRMTAHLAVAQALRRDSKPGSDGQLAYATFLALSNRQRSAASAVDALTISSPAMTAWQRALRLRLTQDWRALPAPATQSRLEKLEYFRARRYTLRRTRGGQDLTDLREPSAVDFGRIVQSRSFGVDDGNQFVVDGLGGEILEVASVYRQLHQRDLPADLPAAIMNVRAGRLLTSGEPQVVPWGAWAEFTQRHIGMSVQKIDYHYRQMLGLPDRADQLKRTLDALGHLTLFPVASTGRTKGKTGSEADLTQIAGAIDVAVRAPELITFNSWNFIETGAKYEMVAREMPPKLAWFAPLSVDVPYDAAFRTEALLGPLAPAAVEALIDEAPFNIGLLSRVAQRMFMMRPLMAKVRVLIEPRVEYDMWAIDAAIGVARDPADRLAMRRKACGLAVFQCLDLAFELIATDEPAAVAEYEKAFRDPALDQVTMANTSGWLVSYYERSGQLLKSLDLAQRSAAVGSARGMLTLAYLLERRSRTSEADELFSTTARRYPTMKTELAAFLYRQAVVANKPAFLVRWKAAESGLFPGGLQPMATVMPEAPAKGVFVEQDSYWSKRVRLQAGDIIVGVDGWKVESKEQYDTVVAFTPAATVHKFTAWRGVLFTVDLTANHGMTLKSHPLKGWIE
jgi:hypothetical protein